MLTIKYDASRSEEDGRYFVELIRSRDANIANCDRLGYWCDKAHLRSMLREFWRAFHPEIGEALIDLIASHDR